MRGGTLIQDVFLQMLDGYEVDERSSKEIASTLEWIANGMAQVPVSALEPAQFAVTFSWPIRNACLVLSRGKADDSEGN
ncbi:MAG: hypothetical protein M0Z66_04615 [Thermaerobacter sp.]|nr:hypothetical protein [Thermaerobacter sp.]